MGRGRCQSTNRSCDPFSRRSVVQPRNERLRGHPTCQKAARLSGRVHLRRHLMSSFSTYIIGFIILIIGLALAAYLLNVPTMWIAVGVIVLIGVGVLMATSRTKHRDPPTV